ncbi:MAG: MBL fold metallo-hydrolase [Spirochaetales bacterium]|nr:MBL fold metallo-hydrolase [Spirochaetales bacterium]MCF7938960.1 MBL fold metallo-hydrolase [Spirochaetales bacterium]
MHREIPEENIFPRKVEIRYESADFMEQIRNYAVPQGATAFWFIGQNGYIIKTEENKLIAIDPYLTDYCASGRSNALNEKSRILPVFIEPEDLKVDLVAITHSHCDHTDPFTWERYRFCDTTRFLAPFQAAGILQEAGIPESSITLMHPRQEWRSPWVSILGTFAEPTDTTDLNHLGYIFRFTSGKQYYNSGDTAKSELLSFAGEKRIDWMSICINGGYHNLSHWEAAEICAVIQPKVAIPAHYDLMAHNIQPPHMFRKSLSKNAPDVEYMEMEYQRPYLLQ